GGASGRRTERKCHASRARETSHPMSQGKPFPRMPLRHHALARLFRSRPAYRSGEVGSEWGLIPFPHG
ncbi:MAG: hypothetical protein V3R16_09275, partial [Nitrospirales bacterium]